MLFDTLKEKARENDCLTMELGVFSFNKDAVRKGLGDICYDGEIYFNAYRLETDGGEMDKHLFAMNPTMRHKFHTPEYYVYLKDYVK